MRIYVSNEPGRPDRTAGGRWELAHNRPHDGLAGTIGRLPDSERQAMSHAFQGIAVASLPGSCGRLRGPALKHQVHRTSIVVKGYPSVQQVYRFQANLSDTVPLVARQVPHNS